MKGVQLFVVSLLFLAATCNKGTAAKNPDLMQISGELERTGMTSYQYGSHTITNDKNFYALKSEKVDLTPYEGKTVSITAEKIEGYPVDGGPEFLKVISVKEK